MSRYELFDPNYKRSQTPPGLEFRLASENDIDILVSLSHQRNPDRNLNHLTEIITREITYNNNADTKYKIFVAVLNELVVGFCRYFHSDQLPIEKKKYPAPEGAYLMGIIVDPKFRKKGIAKFMSEQRLQWLAKENIKEVFSVVAANNLTSIRMHQSFGFTEIDRGPGFLHISFDCGQGILFNLLLR